MPLSAWRPAGLLLLAALTALASHPVRAQTAGECLYAVGPWTS